jgi:hypothetical protein
VTPVRVQLSRTKGWRMPPNTVKVDRTSKWGNPFADYPTRHAQAERFRASLVQAPRPHPESYMGRVLDGLHELRGKNLACWCPLDQPCHADVLLELAICMTPVPCIARELGEFGDCWRACIATILDFCASDVPNFFHLAGAGSPDAKDCNTVAYRLAREWLGEHGLAVFRTYFSGAWSRDKLLEEICVYNPGFRSSSTASRCSGRSTRRRTRSSCSTGRLPGTQAERAYPGR